MDLDLEAFECPICVSLFQGSIFQCKNGHVVCDACRSRIQTCPTCREPIGDIRNRALENVIAGMVLPCSFKSLGCTQRLKHTERRDHEAFHCQHAPCACPFVQGCAYSGLLLYDHIKDAHSKDSYVLCFAGYTWSVGLPQTAMPFRVLLNMLDRSVYMLLNGGDVRSGRSLSVVCLGPRPAANELLEYKLKVDVNKPGALSLSASGSLPCMRRWTGQYPTEGFLFVPDTYWGSLLHYIVVNVHVEKVGGR